MAGSPRAVFLSYASEDLEAAGRIADALTSAGVEVWFDKQELRGGDAWDQKIRRQIRDCALFVPVISANTEARTEGYFRLEWKLAVDRSHLMADDASFLVPVSIDAASEASARVPDRFRQVQWTHLPAGEHASGFAGRIVQLLAPPVPGQRPAEVTRSQGVVTRTHGRPDGARWVQFGAVAVALVAVGGWYLRRETRPTAAPAASAAGALHPAPPGPATSAPPIPERSVAVLPFVDMSEKHDQEYFSDGLSEELIDVLTKAPDLRVPARTSSFYFKGKQTTIAEIARSLGVAHVLEGSVRKSGRTLRITAQLIRADTGYHVWSRTYDRTLDDIFKVQDEIAAAVATALQVSMAGGTARQAPRPANAEAYDLLKRAEYFLLRSTEADQRKALDYYQRAASADPMSAAAWAGLSRATAGLQVVGVASEAEVQHKAREAAERAVALDAGLPEAHVALGKVAFNLEHDFPLAKREFDRARALAPDDSVTIYWTAVIAVSAGDLQAAIQSINDALVRDPLDGEIYFFAGSTFRCAGRLPEAEASFRKALSLVPARPGLHGELGVLLALRGSREAALQEIAREPDAEERDEALAFAYQIIGRVREADSALASLERTRADSDAFEIARLHALRGEAESTLTWLERAESQHEFLLYVKADPWFQGVRGDPRFTALLRRLQLPE